MLVLTYPRSPWAHPRSCLFSPTLARLELIHAHACSYLPTLALITFNQKIVRSSWFPFHSRRMRLILCVIFSTFASCSLILQDVCIQQDGSVVHASPCYLYDMRPSSKCGTLTAAECTVENIITMSVIFIILALWAKLNCRRPYYKHYSVANQMVDCKSKVEWGVIWIAYWEFGFPVWGVERSNPIPRGVGSETWNPVLSSSYSKIFRHYMALWRVDCFEGDRKPCSLLKISWGKPPSLTPKYVYDRKIGSKLSFPEAWNSVCAPSLRVGKMSTKIC
jgi:hypothetical protein